ncbi:hypothetical protein EB796_012192 [Bugula neritina]|uniref:Uncharacterized protein n=1 Tax=Bugula neritina TaxID=10212 RepID=A0A7J7JUA2_BUGNE|nr:hypothetical protein EB796_012192 [Bugula neritina]
MDSAQNQCDQGLRYKDKVVIVTGGSKGIGEGCEFVNEVVEKYSRIDCLINNAGQRKYDSVSTPHNCIECAISKFVYN